MTRLVLDGTMAAPRTARFPVTPDRVEVVVDVVIDDQELDRRERSGAKSIFNLDLLNILLTMPLGSPVPADRFSEYEWRRLDAGSRIGATEFLDIDGRPYATRQAAPPLEVKHVTVAAKNWRVGIRAASRFAPYSSREVVLDRSPVDDLELRLEADYLGIGVRVRGDNPDLPNLTVIEPAPFTPTRFTGASWLFTERLQAQRNLLDD